MADKIDQDWINRNVGIVCDRCGFTRFIASEPARATDVTNTYPKNGVIHRRRVCRNCGWVMWTVETKTT